MNHQPLNNSKQPPVIIPLLKNVLSTRGNEVQQWFEEILSTTPPFFYNSVDLRHSGFKLAPVDTNMFPGGFNNLSANERKHAVQAVKAYLEKHHPMVASILIIAEDHTRNTFYLENVAVLETILKEAGKDVRLTSFACSENGEPENHISHSGVTLSFDPVVKKNDTLQTINGFVPDLVLVNNDMTDGAPDLIQNISQTLTPPLGFGWYQRRKTSHFESYEHLARQFCHRFELDPWLITGIFEKCGVVNFKEKKGIECIALRVDKAIHRITQKYEQYGIKDQPYVFIKSDRGTYGMGIMTVRSGDEIYDMNKNIRKRMNAIKGGMVNTEVIIQEGITTIDKVEEHPAEPMIYLVGGQPVGCIYRLNTKRDAYGNLNASGMQFASVKYHGKGAPCEALGLIAKLAAYASSWECYADSYVI